MVTCFASVLAATERNEVAGLISLLRYIRTYVCMYVNVYTPVVNLLLMCSVIYVCVYIRVLQDTVRATF